jgi:hypothetical protein
MSFRSPAGAPVSLREAPEPTRGFASPGRTPGPAWALALGALALFLALGCAPEPQARVVSAEFLDEMQDGQARQGETILLRFDRPLPPGLELARIGIRVEPPVFWTWKASLVEDDARLLAVKIVTGTPEFQLEGIHGLDAAATGLHIDLGDGVEQAVDLQRRRALPGLLRAVWEDRSAGGSSLSGNGVVDQGDRIRLRFDHPVRLAGEEGMLCQVPQDILLSKDSIDRLDDGVVPSRFVSGRDELEVDIVLGSRPVLTVEGSLPEDLSRIDRFSPSAPSGLALSGTDLIPMSRIAGVIGGPGSLSRKEVDIEFPEDYPRPRNRRGDDFPPPGGPRSFHTVTPLPGAYALVAGGRSLEDGRTLDEVLVYDPYHEIRRGTSPFTQRDTRLPNPTWRHTATLLPGPDRTPGTFDDFVVIAGGDDGEGRSLGDLCVVKFRASGDIHVQPLSVSLRVPRAEHAAVAAGASRLLIDGGRSSARGPGAPLVEVAELFTFELSKESDQVRVSDHQVFSSLGRTGHSLTLLASGPQGETWVLAYGGYGRNRHGGKHNDRLPLGQPLPGAAGEQHFFPYEAGSVLVSPILLDVSNPGAPLLDPAYDYDFALLRSGHAATGLGTESPEGLTAAGSVIIAGGTLRHPLSGFAGDQRDSWEMPPIREPQWHILRPESSLALNAIRFTFDPERPRASRLEVVPHPAPDPSKLATRESFSTTLIPGLGILIAGGESSGMLGKTETQAGMELFLLESGRLAEFATRLQSSRAGHQAFLLENGSRRSVLLIGGSGAGREGGAFADVEEVPVP